MIPTTRDQPHCKRCDFELDPGKETCPECHYNPREKGIRLSMGFLLIVVVAMTITMLAPGFGPVLIVIAGLAFVLSFATFLLSFLVTPHRLGRLFLRV